jgi:lipoyl(octanoyl) transferase
MNLEMKIAKYIDLGVTNYSETFRLQEELAQKRAQDEISDTILISEHFPVVNFGMREVHNTFSEKLKKEIENSGVEFTNKNAIEYLKQKGIDFSRTSRGGGSTFIGPGQINFYPIVKYEKITKSLLGINQYKEMIDEIMYSVLRSYNLDVKIHNDNRNDDIQAKNSNRKDIWIEKAGESFKLGGKGIHIAKGVAYHGFNFYLNKDSIRGFNYVNPCGYDEKELGATSIEEVLGKKVSQENFKKRVLEEIKKKFEYDSIEKGKR